MLLVYPRATGRGETEIVIAENHDCVLHVLTPEQAVQFATRLLSVALEEAALARSAHFLSGGEVIDGGSQS